MKKHATRIHFDFPLWQWLKTEALRRHCSIGQVVRDLVVAEIERREVPSRGIGVELAENRRKTEAETPR